jgi:hemoglobin-like flavoprotein
MQPPCRACHTALPHDGHEDAKTSEVHPSLLKIVSIIIIHFSEHSAIAIYPASKLSIILGSRAMTPESIARVRETWALVAPIADTAADLFYQRLFALDPRLPLMFRSTDWAAQRRKLVHALNLVVASLDKIEKMGPTLEGLASRHASYGVQDSHYDTVGKALIETLEQGLGEAWTVEAAAAWTEAYGIVAGAMRGGGPRYFEQRCSVVAERST